MSTRITRRIVAGDIILPCETVEPDASHHGAHSDLAWRVEGQCSTCAHAGTCIESATLPATAKRAWRDMRPIQAVGLIVKGDC